MRRTRIFLIVFLVILTVFGWVSFIRQNSTENSRYWQSIDNAHRWRSEGLYQKSISAFQGALKVKESESIRNEMIETCQIAFDEQAISRRDYIKVLEESCTLYPRNSLFWGILIDVNIKGNDFRSAHNNLLKAKQKNIKSEELSKLESIIRYSFVVSGKTYSLFYRSPDGYYSLFDGKNWGGMKPDGNWMFEPIYEYVSPINREGYAVIRDSTGGRIVDGGLITQGFFSFGFNRTWVINSAVVPFQNVEGYWQYYDINANSIMPNQFNEASIFQGEYAFVKENNKWHSIRKNGEAGSTVFDDIKLYNDGSYSYDGKMVASRDNQYSVYSSAENRIDFTAKNMDNYFGGPVAFQDDSGKWGFANEQGEVIVQPRYTSAKSFSAGLAAVSDGDLWGFINLEGELVIDFQFYAADYFTVEGRCMVSDDAVRYYFIELRFPKG